MAELYDFYGNRPKTRVQLHEWLTSWLQMIEPSPPSIQMNGDEWIQERGFRLAFCIHGVYRNLRTNMYTWLVLPDDKDCNIHNFPTTHFPSYEAMLDWVVNDYYMRWGLTE